MKNIAIKVYQEIQKVKDTVHTRGLRRSKHIVKCFCETYTRKDEDEEEEEEILNSSHQSTFITSQSSSTQQSLSQQSTIIINSEIIIIELPIAESIQSQHSISIVELSIAEPT
ncbi:hypothetical protein C1645_832811 [Glomus cerebriforme]|uniref:Uncharacterized protein n=1 Tax=Glomus cerebriforme TaxID=658196 RepID=A0A397SIS7_9GLOM|nr:hypothetical protein C1645_832811 [Glomus cerebriforme]